MPSPDTLPLAGVLAQDAESGVSLFSLIVAGGVVGYVILLLSVAAVALVVIHALQLREGTLSPPEVVDALDERLSQGDVDGATAMCRQEENDCFLTRVMLPGLQRYSRSAFGALELKGALEEAGQAQTARLLRSTDALGLIAAIAPMLGLLGTVVGMVGAFDTISASEGFARPDQLAGDISKALVTTLMGLTLAIPATAALTYFRNRIDALTGDVADVVEQLAAHLEHEASEPTAPPRRPTPAGAPS
ncbi:MAG: MotA/TolQ/ExbB proton channel family protein [Phycisphaerales bacterium]